MVNSIRMCRVALGAIIVLACALSGGPGQAVHAETVIRIGGTGMGLALAEELGDAFAAATPDVQVIVLPSMGSTGGMQALADRAIDIGLSGRALKSHETVQGLDTALCLITPLVFATSHPAPNSITPSELPALYSGNSPHWEDGTPLKVIMRAHSGSEHPYLASRIPGLGQAFDMAFMRPGIALGKTDQENATLAGRIAGSFAIMTLLQIRTEGLDLRVVPIDGKVPTAADAATGAYPFPIQVCFVKPRDTSPAAQSFLEFLMSPEAGRIMEDKEAVRVK